jgi:hypothetical protein
MERPMPLPCWSPRPACEPARSLREFSSGTVGVGRGAIPAVKAAPVSSIETVRDVEAVLSNTSTIHGENQQDAHSRLPSRLR